MQERLKEIPTRIVEFWKKYSSRQKTIIIAVVCVVLLLIGIAAYLASRPTYVKFQTFSKLDDANTMASALDDEGISYKASNDGLTLYVQKGDMTNALYAMSDNNLVDTGYTWDDAFDNSMSTTESEKTQKRILALQSSIQKSLVQYSFIDDADVFIDVPTQTYSVLDEEEQTSVTALISVGDSKKDQLTSDTAEALAGWLANAVGTDTDHVIINDTEGNCVYNGATSDALGTSIAGGSTEYCEKLRNNIASNVTKLMVKSGYDDIQVGTQGIRFDMSTVEKLTKTYSVADGREYGYPTNLYTYKSEGGTGSSGEPGTASNDDDTDVVIGDESTSSSLDIQKLTDLLTDETIENIKQETPAIQYDDSSLGIVALRYVVYDEETLEADGTLDNMTFEEFIAANSDRTQITLSDDEINNIAMASGVDASKISVMAYEVPKFVEKTETGRSIADYLMIILAVLIIALLIFVVIRGTAPVKVSEEEPELSVEQLLATTKENQSLEDIEFSDKSETRKMIEKFVDENPEAVAQLLRNWLNDEWDM
jgi:flagellar M-ring protein FliF